MRRTLAALDPSAVSLKIPISAVLATCVPPQSSRETPSISTTRTHSPYFSPKRAIAPSASASARSISSQRTGALALDPLVDAVLDVAQLLGAERLAVGEVEAKFVGTHRRARLADVGAEPLAQRRVQEVRRGVVAHRRVAGRAIDDAPRPRRPAGSPWPRSRPPGRRRRGRRRRPAASSPSQRTSPESATWPPPSA